MDQAQIDIWECALAFVPLAVVKCAIELGIADVLLETPMSNADLSSALNCSPEILLRIMRYLIHRGFFKLEEGSYYAHTPLSRLLVKSNNSESSMAALVLLESSPVMLGPWHQLSSRALANRAGSAFEAANGGEGLWEYTSRNPEHSKLLNEAMVCRAKVDMRAMVDQCPEVFGGVGSMVDVGGGDGTSLRTLVKACPWVQGINFDLPHVVADALLGCEGSVEHVAGDMFQSVPKADAAILISVLHDWSDEECVQILSKCREAIPEGTGKVIIAEGVIREEEEEDKYKSIRLGLDMVMLAHTGKGKERTTQEWEHVVNEAGFARCTIKHLDATISVIQAYP